MMMMLSDRDSGSDEPTARSGERRRLGPGVLLQRVAGTAGADSDSTQTRRTEVTPAEINRDLKGSHGPAET
eukprot:3460603-Rhodomonas_salina.1